MDQVADCGIELVASLPDNWISDLIRGFEEDDRFRHVPVNREESAIGLCSGAFFGGQGSIAVMGASGLMTLVYAITKINYTYEIPVLILITLRGAPGDLHKHHVSNGLYLLPCMESINLPYMIIDSQDKIPHIKRAWDHSRTISRPVVAVMTRDVLRGEA
jgi:sulfopyruvate decarboxylase subunit alpha